MHSSPLVRRGCWVMLIGTAGMASTPARSRSAASRAASSSGRSRSVIAPLRLVRPELVAQPPEGPRQARLHGSAREAEELRGLRL